MQIYTIDFGNVENEKYSLNKIIDIFRDEKTKPYAIVVNPETSKKMTLTIEKPQCGGYTCEHLLQDNLFGYLLGLSDKIAEDVAKIAYDEAEFHQIIKYGATFAELEQKAGYPGPMAIAMTRINTSKTPRHILELMENISKGFVMDPDFRMKMERRRHMETATEAMHKCRDSFDTLSCALLASQQVFGVAVKSFKPLAKVSICDEIDTWLPIRHPLEQKLKTTKGKARRKIRRQLRKWKLGAPK